MFKTQIQVLLIEDSPADAIFLREALGKDALTSFEVTTVERLKSAIEILENHFFDIILLDLGLPDSQGLVTFKRIHLAVPGIPKVILSGLTDEAFALQAVQAGAQDYIVKGQAGWDSAARAVHYAIERQHTQKALGESEQRYQHILDAMLEGCQIIGFDWRFHYINDAADRHNRRPKTELLGKKYMDMWPGIETTDVFKAIERSMKERIPEQMENKFIFPDGTQGWFSLSIQPVPEGVFILSIDITERKRAEVALRDSENRFRGFLNSAPDAMVIVTEQGQITLTNAKTEELFGYTQDELLGKDINILIPEHLRSNHRLHQADFFTNHHNPARGVGSDLYALHKDGREFPVEILLSQFNMGDEIVVLSAIRDITERKRAESALRESQARYQNLFENSPISIWDEDFSRVKLFFDHLRSSGVNNFEEYFQNHPEAINECMRLVKILDVNHITLDLMGIETKSEVLDELSRSLGPDSQETFKRELVSLTNGDPQFEGEEIIQTKTGIKKNVLFHINVAPGFENTLGKVIVSVIDITERKQAEEKLRQSEEQYRYLFENNPHPMWAYDLKTLAFLAVNDAAVEKYGYTREEFLRMTIGDIRPPEDMARLMKNLGQPRPILQHSGDWRHQRKDGSLIDVEISSHILNIGNRDAALVVAKDITERKQAEQELRQSNERFTELVDNVSDMFWIADPFTRRDKYVSPAFETIVGLSHESVEQLPNGFLDVVIPEDQPILKKAQEQEYLGYKTDIQYRIHRPDGSIRWLRDKGSPVFDENGKVVRVVGVARDLTEQTEAEIRLRESETRFRQLAENIHEVFWMYDRSLQQMIYTSPAYETIWGHSRESLYQNSIGFMEDILADDRPLLLAALEQQARGENTETEYRIQRPDGSIRWVWDRSFPVLDSSGNLARTAGVATDITERKQAESEANHRQKLLEKVIQLGKNITAITDLQSCLREIHRSITQELDFDRCGLFLYDRASRTTRGTYGSSRTGQIEDNRWYVETTENWKDWENALQNPSGVTITDDYQLVHNPPEGDEMYGVKQHVTMAAWSGDRPVAMINVDNLISQRLITGVDLEALQLFAGYAGLAIENARLNAGLEQRVRERTAEVQDLYDNAPAGYHSVDTNGLLIMINQTELDWLGYTRAELVGIKTIFELLASGSQQKYPQIFQQLIKQGTLKDIEIEFLRKDGSLLPVLLNATAVYDANGKFVQSRATIFDIKERKKAEIALRDSQERLNFLLAKTPAVIFTAELSVDTPITFTSNSVRTIMGYTPEQFLENPKFMRALVHPDDIKQSDRAFENLLIEGHVIWESRIKHADGEYRWMSTGVSLLRDEQGQPVEMIGYSVDINEEKRAQAALRESEDQNRLLFEESPDAITLVDKKGKILRANHGFERLTKLPREEMLGHTAEDLGLITLETRNHLLAALLRARRNREPFASSEYIITSADGLKQNVDSRIFLLKLGGIDHILVTTRDITTRKKAEQALRHANTEMERAMRMKDEFLASMSHELRTPLTSILGLSEGLQLRTYGDLTEKQLKALKNIETSGRHLLDLINDILDLSKIEAGKLDLRFEPCALADICQTSLLLIRGMAHQKHQAVGFSANQTSITVRADPRRLKQMLVNLLSNAIKFTPDGGALGLDVQLHEKEHVVRITVWDRGPGIRAEDLPKLFKPFVQLDSSLSRQYSGTGLGLSLVHKMAELHGGSVQVESTPGEGSLFTITLPWSADATQPVPVSYHVTTPLHLALLIEDNQLDIERITRYMQNIGISTGVHTLVLGAFEKAVQIRPSVILLDLNLHDRSGLEVLKKLKASDTTRDIPVVIVSVEESRSLATSLGAAGYLVKPFSEAELRAELDRLSIATGEISRVNQTTSPNKGPSLIIIDDNEVILETISDFLDAHKYRVTSAKSGKELLDLGASIHPDLILLDIQMPGMDGLEAIRRIRTHTDERLAKTPIIAITALSMPGDRERCLASGADEYLSKPLNLMNLLNVIKELLERGTAPR
jgi:PAS domain S-box-containing protein